MLDTSSKAFNAGAKTLSEATADYFQTVFKIHANFGNELGAAASRIMSAAYLAKIPEDVFEAAAQEHEGLVAHAFETARQQFKAVGALARNHYAGLVHAKVLPCSILQSTQVNNTLEKVEGVTTEAVNKLEAARKKVVDPMGFSAPKKAK